jgi:hypothetical protein
VSDARIDELARLAFAEARAIEPTDAEIQAVVRRAHAEPSRRRPARRVILAAAATLTLAAGTALAVPQSRDVILDGFGTFKDFFTGGEPPGTPVPGGEKEGQLNWFGGSDVATGSVIAQAGSVRLIAYREPTTGMACLGYSLAFVECRPDTEWSQVLARSPVVVSGPLPQPDAAGRLPLLGITADNIATIEIRYADGGSERVDNIQHGFVLFAEPKRTPATLIARDQTGVDVATIDISDRQWEFNP